MSQYSLEGTGAARGSLQSYITGFSLSLILTAIPFALVMSGSLSHAATLVSIFSAGVIQILVHLYFFLHLDTSSKMRWNLWAALFTLAILVLFVYGSIWIMYNLYSRMM